MKSRLIVLTCFFLAAACSSTGGGGTGGSANTGGSVNTGGSANTGGTMNNTGGMSGTGGALPDPCAGKMCGEACSVDCDPADPNCIPPDIDKLCDQNGNCSVGIPTCGP